MGWVKRHMMELQERGDWPSSDLAGKYVCCSHFKDKYLNGMIASLGQNGACSYCGAKGTVCNMEKLGVKIVWKIGAYYKPLEDAALPLADGFYDDESERIPGYKRIGEYVAPEELEYYDNTEELLCEMGVCTDDEDLNEDLKGMFTTEQWVSSDIYDENMSVRYANQWGRFVDTVTHRARFTFLATPEFKKIVQDGFSDDILSVLNELIIEQGLVRTLAKGTNLYRARKVDSLAVSYTFDDITAPPEQFAYPNRMSPAGISMFYASFVKETALEECVGENSEGVIVGCFETKKDLRIIDLTSIPQPSFWMENWQGNLFLHHFNENITKRINPNDTNHLQYVPTQVFTEYLRYMFKDKHSRHVDGLIYGSSKTDEKNIVLFCNQKESRCYLDGNVRIDKYRRGWISSSAQ